MKQITEFFSSTIGIVILILIVIAVIMYFSKNKTMAYGGIIGGETCKDLLTKIGQVKTDINQAQLNGNTNLVNQLKAQYQSLTQQFNNLGCNKAPTPSPLQSCDNLKTELSRLEQQLAQYQQKLTQKGCDALSSGRIQNNPLPINVNCHDTKVINGITYALGNVSSKGNTYYAIYTNAQHNAQFIVITKQEYDAYVSKCNFPHPIMPQPIGDSTCEGLHYLINSLQASIVQTKQQLLNLHCEGGHTQAGQ